MRYLTLTMATSKQAHAAIASKATFGLASSKKNANDDAHIAITSKNTLRMAGRVTAYPYQAV
ncbi:MAG: hypothetical protein HOZ81_32715 [Streptomyces sp.]|nr:hypothetical protein [Streptomyces sp.]NUS89439.1 hypothetical protein [Streptomyces sp.]